jgi:hypothetical protein
MNSRRFRVIKVGNNGRSSQFEILCDNGSRVESNLFCHIDRRTGSKRNSIATITDAGCSEKEKISDPSGFASVMGSQIFQKADDLAPAILSFLLQRW